MKKWTRRDLLHSSVLGGVAASSGYWATSSPAFAAPADDRTEDLKIARMADKIMATEPGRIVDMVLGEMKKGMSRQQLLAASYNAGARWRGHHQAYVAHPVQDTAQQIESKYSLLPLFYYQSSLRFREAWKEGVLEKVNWKQMPSVGKAEKVFHGAMEEGDRPTAALALVALARNFGPRQAYHHLWIYGAARNHRSGGHTAISIANTFRTMEATNWRCAEAALRFAVHDAGRAPRGSNLRNVNHDRAKQVDKLPPTWSTVKVDKAITLDLLQRFREGRSPAACRHAFDLLRQGRCTAGTVWNAVFLCTSELVMRIKYIGAQGLAGHSVTCVNGLHYMYRTVRDPVIRLYALLEAVEWTTSFLARERARPSLRKKSILDFEQVKNPKKDLLEESFSLLPPRRFAAATRIGLPDKDKAAQLAYTWLQNHQDPRGFTSMALKLMCTKSSEEVHDFKFPMALLENCRYTDPQWHPNLLAASTYVFQGTDMKDNKIVKQAREALKV